MKVIKELEFLLYMVIFIQPLFLINIPVLITSMLYIQGGVVVSMWQLHLHLHIQSVSIITKGAGGSMSQVVGLPNNSYNLITNMAWVNARLCKLQYGYTRHASASDKIHQLLAHGRWFFPGTSASSTTKTGRHDIAEILLKMALNTKIQIQFYHY